MRSVNKTRCNAEQEHFQLERVVYDLAHSLRQTVELSGECDDWPANLEFTKHNETMPIDCVQVLCPSKKILGNK